MKLRIAVLAGDGIGPEVTAQASRLLQVVADLHGHTFEFEEWPVGGAAIKQAGTPLPPPTLDACLASDAVLLGAVGAPEHDNLAPNARPETGLLALRKALGAYANLRPVVAYEAISECSPLRPEIARDSDVLIVRELLGGLYFGQPRGFLSEAGASSAFNTMRYSVTEIELFGDILSDEAAVITGSLGMLASA